MRVGRSSIAQKNMPNAPKKLEAKSVIDANLNEEILRATR
jgi:hypothetical protein